ncbi:hypothetical protein OE88DRAFT_1621965 [Heliocybe sulcata]|uniref:THO complex subunit 2 n=1 Tax=Heliocybe sulcata TaxID=5364 RepID=A0A5C3NFP4_9AGAM|nr:hypothetical protein OE88DRAFT_1621965 [Heliocybe sulcata]
MDVVDHVRRCLENWEGGGEAECRSILISPHCNPTDPGCAEVLSTAYHTLIASALAVWNPPTESGAPAWGKRMSAEEVAGFVQSVVRALPEGSRGSEGEAERRKEAFGEVMVDMLWALEMGLEEMGLKQTDADRVVVAGVVRELIVAGVLDRFMCRERMDTALLENAGLIGDHRPFEKKEVRARTGTFYKQNKFNLLREQSEGYAKLIAELAASVGPPHNPATGLPSEPWREIAARARPVWDRIIALIGYFDLDPNRTLDVILDVFAVHLETHYSFFLVLLAVSAWSAVEFRPEWDGSVREEEEGEGGYRGLTVEEVLEKAERRGRGVFRPVPARKSILAQVLGFKFWRSQTPGAEEPKRNLFVMAALLVREGFVGFEELYAHIGPDDEQGMEKAYKEYLASVDARISGARLSQLALAAPLESSSAPSSSKSRPAPVAETKKAEPKPVLNYKARFLDALLAVGALRPAMNIMNHYPWLFDAHTELADLMLRILKVAIAPLYDSVFARERPAGFDQPSMRFSKDAGRVVTPPQRTPKITLWAPTPPPTYQVDFVFFYPWWADGIPLATTLDDLVDVVEPLLRYISVHISRDNLFLTKFLRLGRSHMATTVQLDPETKKPVGEPDPEHPVRKFWFKICRLYLLPALPLIRGNAVCTVEIWNIVRYYETTKRWQLYGEWKTKTYREHSELRVRQVQADRESKGILRRLSHNTVDTLSGTVAKLAHSNPCIFFANAVNQIMAYDNLAGVVIQALRYVTTMGFDVLLYIILDALANPNKNRVKDDGVNTADWLQSLASFTGMLFRRYSADLTPLLKYIVNQLLNGETAEIVVLRELIWKMAGIEPLPNLNESQIAAMAGGPGLRIEAVASSTRGARLDPSDAVLKGPQRLGKALLDSSLATPLLIQVAQQRQSCVFAGRDTPLKALSGLFDTTHGVLLQYLDLLTSPAVVSPNDYATKVIPSLADLGESYGICPPICMQIYRPVLQVKLLAAALTMQEKERRASEEQEKRLKAALTAKREPSSTTSRVASPAAGESGTTAESEVEGKSGTPAPKADDVVMEGTDAGSALAPATFPSEPWLPELHALFDDVKKILPAQVSQVLGPAFYLTFWQLSTYDLSPPATRYDEEGATLRTLSRQEDSKYAAADRSSDRAKRATAVIHRSKRDRYNAFGNALTQEFKEQTASRVFTLKRLAREKQHWFAHSRSHKAEVSLAIVEYCLQPRCLMSPMDADFSVQFIKVMHGLGTPGFSTLQIYDKLIGDHVKAIVFSCSEYEARNYGRFLLGILTDLQKWFQDEQFYIQDNRSKVGGKSVVLPGMVLKPSTKTEYSVEDLLSHSQVCQIVRKWHRKLMTSFIACIETGEFMHVYNAIVVLKEVLPVFPLGSISPPAGFLIDSCMRRFLEKEERGDLKILGRAYHAGLQKREHLWLTPEFKVRSTAPALAQQASSAQGKTASSGLHGEQARAVGRPNAADTNTSNGHSAASPSNTPSAPRAQLAGLNGTSHAQGDKQSPVVSGTKSALESVPRPEVVKRIRTEPKATDNAAAASPASVSLTSSDRMDVDPPASVDGKAAAQLKAAAAQVAADVGRPSSVASPLRKDLSQKDLSRPLTPAVGSPHPPQANMPPPSVPSQTVSAQELRETARQTITTRSSVEKEDAGPSRRRLQSPPTRPGTRPPSADSRGSGGRPRSDTGRTDDRRSERDARRDARELGVPDRRDSRADRSARDRDMEREREKDRGRDRHSDRERERERDRDHRDRDRDRDRERDRDRDRHRRDDKDRDRDSRKDRGPGSVPGLVGVDDRGLPTRPDPLRSRPSITDDSIKRRRLDEDEVRRLHYSDWLACSKRGSRRDGREAHRDERNRRPSDKDGHERGRDSERRRKDRDGPDGDGRNVSVSSIGGEKRVPEGPSAKPLPSSTPSAPRAMASGDLSRSGKPEPIRDRDRRPSRDPAPHMPQGAPASRHPEPAGGSLRARISDKEVSRSAGQSSELPYRVETDRTRAESARDNDRDVGRKRTLSERERDVNETSTNAPPPDLQVQPPKRPRYTINRNRYVSSPSLVRKGLPIDPHPRDKSGGRKG